MRARARCILAAAVLAGAASGCGDDALSGAGTVLAFTLDVEGARQEGRLARDAKDEDVRDLAIDVARARLERLRIRGRKTRAAGPAGFEVFVPMESKVPTDRVVATLTAWGDLAFRIEVLPERRYRGSQRTRFNLWPGTEEDFDDYVRNEIERRRSAESGHVAYEPSDPRFRLVRRYQAKGDAPSEFALVEEPTGESERFGGGMVESATIGRESYRAVMPVVMLEIRASQQRAFEAWTLKNVGLPMAILLDGEYRMAPYINSPLRDIVQITLGSGSIDEAEREADGLVAVFRDGAMPARARLESTRKVEAGGR